MLFFKKKKSPFAQETVLADEADRAHFKSELLVGTSKVVEHDVHKWHLFHFWSVDLKYCLFIALFQLWKRTHTQQEGGVKVWES